MTFEKLWEQFEKQNPTLKTAKTVSMPVPAFRKAARLCYEQGSKMATGAAQDLLRDLIRDGKKILEKGR